MPQDGASEKESPVPVSWNVTDYNQGKIAIHPFWSNTSEVPSDYHIGAGVIMCISSVISIFGNGMVLLVICKFKRMHSSANILVGNLAFADIIMSGMDATFVTTSSFYRQWIFGNLGCKAYAYIVSIVSILSISTLTLIAIDRYVVIVKCWVNYRRSRKKTAVWFLIIAWVYAIFWATCPLFGWGAFMLEGFGSSCTFDYLTRSLLNTSYVICLNIFAFFIPISIITVCYINIIRAMYKHRKDMKNVLQMLGTNPRVTRGKKLNIELKTARALAIAIVLFCAAWAPYAIMSLIAQFGDVTLISRLATGIPGIAAKCVTCMNPFLYAISNPVFLRKIKEVLCLRHCDSKESLQTRQQEIEESSSTKNKETQQIAVYLPNLQTCVILKTTDSKRSTSVILSNSIVDAGGSDSL